MKLEDSVKAWFDPLVQGYRFYTKSGEEILHGMGGNVTIDDNWNKVGSPPGYLKIATCVIRCTVQVVNEMPVKNNL